MDVSYILESLNPAQREAVAAPPSHLLVLAGAGSGKTRVLVHRIAWLIQTDNLSPHGIMAVTFTNKAAREMRGRLEQLLGRSLHGLWVGTFHSIAHRLLRAHWHDAGLPENFQILDSDDQLRLIKRLMKQLNVDDSRWPPRQVQGFINAQKDEGRRAAHVQTGADLYRSTMVTLYAAYEEACERGGMVDFGELLLRAHELWLNRPELLAHYQQRFRHVLVDEFQDTNTIQYAWLRVLVGQQSHITAVGDDDQSIYGWRGAKIENIQQFGQDFAASQVVRLEQNYRSTGSILAAANHLISHNQGRLGKELWTEGEQGEPIALYAGFNEQDEARFIVDTLKQWRDQGKPLCESAVLYRSNAQSRILEETLIRAGLPYRIYGGQRFFERLEIKNALSYLRLLLNRDDDAALERVINVPARGIGARTLEILREHARNEGCSLWQAAHDALSKGMLSGRAASALRGFIQLIDTLDNASEALSLHELADQVIAASGLKEHHLKEKGEKGQARVENLDELVTAARQFEPVQIETGDTPDGSETLDLLAAFLDEAALNAGDAQAEEFEDSVQLMTLHSAKGLEFPLVVMAGVEEGLFPHRMSVEEPGRLEEERRLCYVGITRAMHKLYLTYAESRRLHGKETYNTPSRFIREIPEELLSEVRLKTQISRPVTARRGFLQEQDVPDTGLSLGQRVLHPVFGEGVILNYEGQGAHARVQVGFDTEGDKWLVLSYAKLEAL